MRPQAYCPMILLSSVFITLAGCGGSDDVPPGNTSQTVQQPIDIPQETPGQAQNQQQQASNQAADDQSPRADIDDLIPAEYRQQGEEIARLAVAYLQPTAGNETSGTVVFIEGDLEDNVRIIGRIENIEPGSHGFHIHESGDCTTPDASSAGDHYNPTDALHADRGATVRHVGDLGNLLAAADRTASFDFQDTEIALQGTNSVIEKSFIIHAMEDDLMTQPSGNSGDRIACGVIKRRDAVGIPE